MQKVAKLEATQGRRMFTIAVALAAGVLIAAFALPRAQPRAQPIGGDDAPVLASETALGDAMRAGDKAAARRLLALQFSFVDADGKIYARRDFLADLKGLAAAPASDTVTAKTARTNLTAGLRVMSVSLSAVSGDACSKPKQNLMGACARAQLEL